jgi:arsenate reductase (glutaredoxin)
MTLHIYGIGNCDTVKKTLKFLDSKKVGYQFHDFKKQAPTSEQLKTWLKHFGAELLINRRGTTWRNLKDSEKALIDGNLQKNEKPLIELLIKNSSMIKRPIIESGKSAIIGFDETQILAFIKK